MNADEIKAGIAVYKDQQKEILDAIKSSGGRLHKKAFYNIFCGIEIKTLLSGETVAILKDSKIRMWPLKTGSFVLGGLDNTEWSKMWHLARLMAECGLIRIDGDYLTVVESEDNP